MRYGILFAVGAILVAAIGFFAWQGFLPSSPIGADRPIRGLEPGKGRGLVLTHCGVCHSTALVVSFRASRERWDAVITRMQQEEGLWGFSKEEREAILDYLEMTQGPVGSGGLSESPWAQPLYLPNPIW